MPDLLARKPLEMLIEEAAQTGEHSLKRVLGPINLVALGVGMIIGAGIFVLTGAAAAQFTGPAIILSFVLAGIGCAFAGLCYAEFASLIPISGYSMSNDGLLPKWAAAIHPRFRTPWTSSITVGLFVAFLQRLSQSVCWGNR